MDTYIRKESTISSQLDDDLVMVDIEKGKYFSLNSVATRIWELLDTPSTIQEVCEKLIEEYEISLEQCQIEVENHISEMVELGLVQKK